MADGTWGEPGRVTAHGNGLWQIDLGFRGREGVIAAYLLAGADELALVETGPTTTLPALLAGIRAAGFEPAALGRVFVSHIHLDHSGGAGVLLRDHAPEAVVHVHPLGAPHLTDPARLLASADRLYTGRMDDLWGEVAPIPAQRVVAWSDGDSVETGGRPLTGLYTPGHAAHHVTLWDPFRGVAFTGDVGGVRMAGTGYAVPPAPPPELDPEAWAGSVERLRGLGARRLFLTHGGGFEDVSAHLDQLMPNLDELRSIVKAALLGGEDRAALTERVHAHVAEKLGPVEPGVLANLEWATPSFLAAAGLSRLLAKRGEVPAAAA